MTYRRFVASNEVPHETGRTRRAGWCVVRGLWFGVAAGAFVACEQLSPTTAPLPPAAPMGPLQFQAIPSGAADHRIAYGTDPSQFGDLRIPTGAGPHPVVILVHGGCWKERYATLRDLAPMAEAMKSSGLATWNIEYRRLPQPGSGWPGTYADVASAADFLRVIAAQHRLDIQRVVVVGHSAGGHLALWAAARSRLRPGSPLATKTAIALKGVVSLAGVGDIEAFIPAQLAGCRDPAVVEALLGGSPAEVPERYADASAIKSLPLGVPQALIWGQRDAMTPLRFGEDYESAARKAGDDVTLTVVPSLGHFEIADPSSAAWPIVRDTVRRLLGAP